MRKLTVLILMCVVLGWACSGEPSDSSDQPSDADQTAPAEDQAEELTAVAELKATEGHEASGTVTFTQVDGGVEVVAHVHGLAADASHGFHIHEIGDCSAPDGTSAGGHFNPEGVDHGGPDSTVHHVGDLGNLKADGNGHASLEMTYSFLSLKDGEPNSILGRGLIVHAGPDDLTSQPTGAAGARLACGVIEKQ